MTLTLAESTALVSSVFIVRYYDNVLCVLFGSFGCCAISVFFAIMLDINITNFIFILIIIYFIVMFREFIFLNGIVCCLNFSPNGYESIYSLIFIFFINFASSFATIIGSYIVEIHSFEVLTRINGIIMLIQLLIVWLMAILYKNYKNEMRRKYSILSL